jgi:hypothetical protein
LYPTGTISVWHSLAVMAFLVRHSSLNYREFKTNKLAGTYFLSLHSSHLKPIQTTSVICTRTLSNLFAKRIEIPFCKRE